MKILGLEIYRDSFGIDVNVGMLLIPVPNMRRYERVEITSEKDGGKIKHTTNLRYKIRSHNDPISVHLSRIISARRLQKENERILKQGREKIKSQEDLYSKY